MVRKTSILILVLLFSLTVSASQTALLEMGDSGDAKVTITQDPELDVESASIIATADDDGMISVSGTYSDSTAAPDADYRLQITSQASDVIVEYQLSGQAISDMVTAFGDFDFDITLSNSADELNVRITGTMGRTMMEEQFFMDPDLIREDIELFKTYLGAAINEILLSYNLSVTPQVVIDEFSISGDQTLDISMEFRVENWGDFLTLLLAEDFTLNKGFGLCFDLSEMDMVSLVFGSTSETLIEVSASGGVVSGKVTMDSVFSGSAGGTVIQAVNMLIEKTGSKSSITGTLAVDEVQPVLTCLLQGILPGDYAVSSIDYNIAKSPSGGSIQSIEAKLSNLARKSGSDMEVSFPADVTSDMDITVKAPSGMSITSVEGGSKENDRTAVSSPGEEFTVTYGGAAGLDMNLIIIITVIILVLILLLRKKKKSLA